MPNNAQLVADLAGEIVREVDLSEYADALAGKRLQIRVNPPCIIEEISGKPLAELPRDKIVGIVCLFIGGAPEEIAKLDDTLLFWIYGKSLQLYSEYHGELRKNSAAR